MRVMAMVTGDTQLRALFQSSGDVYILLASAIFGKPIDLIFKQERDQAKTICLGN